MRALVWLLAALALAIATGSKSNGAHRPARRGSTARSGTTQRRRRLPGDLTPPMQGTGSGIVWKESSNVYRPAAIAAGEVAAQIGVPWASVNRPQATVAVVSEAAWNKVKRHLESKTHVELGGVLLGLAAYDVELDTHYTIVIDAAPASGGKSSSIRFEFTSEGWESIRSEMERSGNRLTIVGWYHSHPGFGIFLSSTDMHTQQSFFSQNWQLALVYDPLSGDRGFFAGARGAQLPEGDVVGFDPERVVV
jgi:proteasome lid subunit RPN8/RPN11